METAEEVETLRTQITQLVEQNEALHASMETIQQKEQEEKDELPSWRDGRSRASTPSRLKSEMHPSQRTSNHLTCHPSMGRAEASSYSFDDV